MRRDAVCISLGLVLVVFAAPSVVGQTIDPADTIFPDRLPSPEDPDPMARDEDISGATVTVEIERNEDGFYEYTYTVANPESSKGRIGGLLIDLQCDQEFEGSGLPPQDDGARWNFGIGGPEERRVPRTPAITRAPLNQGTYALTVSGAASFGLGIDPGERWTGMKIISPVEPGMRPYQLEPSFNMDPDIWDMDSIEVGEEVPGPRDFWVNGMIEAPACPDRF